MMTPTSILFEREQSELIARCIRELPKIYREALEHDLASGDDESLAREAGISVVTVRTRRLRARRMLKVMLEQAQSTPHRSPSPPPS